MLEILLPDPSLVVLVGAAGSGKTSFARRHFAPAEVFASDALRALVAGDEADQRATRPAFGLLHRGVTRRLASGRLAVVDATNVQRHARRALLRRARAAGVPAIAIVLDLPATAVVERNAGRAGRVVDEEIVRLQLAQLRAAVDGDRLIEEGFDVVYRIGSTRDLDEVTVRRTGPATPVAPLPSAPAEL